jgi:hypothetical protein
MPMISTGLVPVHTNGTTSGVPFLLTRFFFREELGRLRVDVTLRSSTGDLELDVVVFGADDATYTLSSTALLTGVVDEGVTRMGAFAAVPNDVAGKRLVGVGVSQTRPPRGRRPSSCRAGRQLGSAAAAGR